MTVKEERLICLRKSLKELVENGGADIELDHGTADDLLVEFINDKEVTDFFYSLEKWYA